MSERAKEESVNPQDLDADSLLAAMREVVTELHPHLGGRAGITLDSSLDRDLGLDSLSRMELLSRLERRFGAGIPETVMANAETARELLPALLAGGRRTRAAASVRGREARLDAVDAIPTGASTLLDAVDFHAHHHGDRVHVELWSSHGDPVQVTFADLVNRAERVAAGLVERGLEPGRSAALMLPTGVDYLAAFLGVQMAGAIPVPIYPPARPSQIEDHVVRHAGILANANVRTLVTFDAALGVSRLLTAQVPGLGAVVDVASLGGGARLSERPPLDESSTAFLQYTSGSTGSPKGVVLSHGDVLASLRAMAAALGATPRDLFVSWLPLYHDMGLIGAWMGSLYYGFPLVLMSPLDFLARPDRWLEAIHRHRGTLSGGPNFAYELCVRRVEPEHVEGLDLSSWRIAFNGAEPVSPDTMDRFAAKFAPCGFDPHAMTPVYGLAEATLGVAFTPIGRGPRVEMVDADAFARGGEALPLSGGPSAQVRRFVSCGPPIPGFEVRIVDDRGTELRERTEGAIEFRGPSTTAGYHRNPAASRALFDGEWLRSGDRGYVAGGELHVTGRDKDLIVRAGRNLYPYDLEAAVGGIEGVRKGCVAVFASSDPVTGTERLVVVAETREKEPGRRREIVDAVTRTASALLGGGPDEIVLAPPHTVLKTSSGKIRRSAVRELFENGALRRGAGSVRLQVARLALAAARGTARSWALRAARAAYALHAGLVIGVTFALAWPAVVVLPGSRHARWRRGRVLVRAALPALGIRLRVSGASHLEGAGPFVVVANHASYLDGPVLLAALPAPVGYVVKGELEGDRFLAPLLRALGVEFVHRLDHERSVADVESLTERLKRGETLGFFPEGTLHRMPGLLPFRLGAFSVAVAGDAGVVPVTMVGSRSALRDGQWIPRPGTISVRIGSPIAPADSPSGMAPGERGRGLHAPSRGGAPGDGDPTAQESADRATRAAYGAGPGAEPDRAAARRADPRGRTGLAPRGVPSRRGESGHPGAVRRARSRRPARHSRRIARGANATRGSDRPEDDAPAGGRIGFGASRWGRGIGARRGRRGRRHQGAGAARTVRDRSRRRRDRPHRARSPTHFIDASGGRWNASGVGIGLSPPGRRRRGEATGQCG